MSLTPQAIEARLGGVVPLSRREAAEIAAYPGAREPLLRALTQPATQEPAALLLGEIGHADDLGPLLEALRTTAHQDILLEALARLGPPALEPLARMALDPPENLMRLRVAHGLASMACLHESTADRVARLFIELIERPDLPDPELAQLSLWLDVLDRREAFPVLERRLAGAPASTYNEARLNEWKARPPGQHPDRLQYLQPFERFLDEHRAEYFRLLEALISQASVLPGRLGNWRQRFDADLQELRAREPARHPDLGRNDPCWCGSGRKYKKCHLDSDDSLERRFSLLKTVVWPSVGHGMLPSQQWEQLPAAELLEHLEVLALSEADVARRTERETDDYLLWSCAQNRIVRGLWPSARELATLVAASQQGHPALNYDEIALVAQSTDQFIAGTEPPLADLQFMLNSANFALAWESLRQTWWQDVEEGLRIYRTVLEARPGLLWSAAALAETARACSPERALPEVRAALKRAREGASQAPPGLPGRACPVGVLEAYVQDLEVAVARSKQFEGLARRLLERPVEDRLSPGLELTRSRYQALDADLKRNLEEIPADQAARRQEVRRHSEERRLQLAFELGQHFQTVVASDAVASASRPGEVLWILPVKAPPGLRAQRFAWHSFVPMVGDSPVIACGNALGEVVRSTRALKAELIPCTWRGFAAWWLRVETDETDLDEMARLIASDKLDSPFVDALWAPLERELVLSGEPSSEGSLEGDASEDEPAELASYLSRVLTRLLRHRKVGAAHTDKSLFVRGVPTRLRGELKDLLEELIAQGYVREKPTVTGAHISLEPARLAEIKRFLAGEEKLLGIQL